MRSRLRLILLIIAAGALRGMGQEQTSVIPSPEASASQPWAEIFGAAPGGWSVLVVAAIGASALAAHLAYVLARARCAPLKLMETLKYAIDSGNYQEAWEACGIWRATLLGRILQPALERIGQGQERVHAALARCFDREQRVLKSLLWALLAVGVGVPLLCGVIAGMAFVSIDREPAVDARLVTLAAGNFAVLAAAIFAVVAVSAMAWLGFRARVARQLPILRGEAELFVRDLSYEDLEGLRIGKDFDAGTILGADEEIRHSGLVRVSRELTTACPNCNAPINPSRNPCPHCGVPFEWS